MKKILLFGADGQLGRAFSSLCEKDDKVELIKDSETEITNFSEVDDQIKHHKPDVVFSTAAFHDLQKCEENPDIANYVNGFATKHMCDAAHSIGAMFIWISTNYVFDGANRGKYSSRFNRLVPLNKYGESKRLGEFSLADYSNRYNWYIIRTAGLFGVGGSKSFPEKMIELGEKNNSVLVKEYEYSSIASAEYVARAALECALGQRAPGVYHAVNDGIINWYDVAKFVFEKKNIKADVFPASTPHDFGDDIARPQNGLLQSDFKQENWQDALANFLREI